MHRINLFPWRVEEKRQSKRRFLRLVVMITAVTVFSQFFINRYFQSKVTEIQASLIELKALQQALNQRLTRLASLEVQQQKTSENLSHIIEIQESRYLVAFALRQLPPLIPDALFLEELSIQRDDIILKGVTNEVSLVNVFAEALKSSSAVFEFEVDSIAAKNQNPDQHDFSLSFRFDQNRRAFNE
ncbi:PilN domain-containing protein [Vibrio sp. DW001]|uniref:PilN domain-containing protein n=1 Tax=Vibrio sp. DW001 TaxID=2912315 RepID=UPI0023B1722D|nr:PilN domain-containing protein [Vibrio sp. DW001]WED26907.1 PilN domain-containing protein [Vibrio sp. DW001]